MSDLPRGTVTLLFTDIEGSTQLQHALADRYQDVVSEHRRLMEAIFTKHGGVIVDRQTESFFVVFARARSAVQAAADAQQALAKHEWPEGVRVKVRMGIHSGDPEVSGDRYVGLAVSRAARICASAHGGQVLLSSSARALLSDHDRTALRNLGVYRLKDFAEPEPIAQLVVDGLPAQFPPLRTGAAPSRRKRLLLASVGLFLAVVLAVAIVAFTTGGGSIKVGPTSLAVIDSKSNKVVDVADLGFKSNLIAAGEGSIWVVNPKRGTLLKIDPHTHDVETFGIAVGAGDVPFGLAAGEGAVWIAVLRGTRQVVLEFGPEIGDLRREIAYGGRAESPVVGRYQPLAVGEGAVWAIDTVAGGVWRIRPRAGTARKLIDGLDALAVAVGGGAVWVAGSSQITKIDPVTGDNLLESGPIGSQAVTETASVAFGANAVWFAASSGQTLVELDPQSLSTLQTVPVGRGPSGVDVGEDAVWVANSRDGTLSRVDPRNPKHARLIRLGQPPGGVVAAYGKVWSSPGEPRR